MAEHSTSDSQEVHKLDKYLHFLKVHGYATEQAVSENNKDPELAQEHMNVMMALETVVKAGAAWVFFFVIVELFPQLKGPVNEIKTSIGFDAIGLLATALLVYLSGDAILTTVSLVTSNVSLAGLRRSKQLQQSNDN